jgi:hypothetical protein
LPHRDVEKSDELTNSLKQLILLLKSKAEREDPPSYKSRTRSNRIRNIIEPSTTNRGMKDEPEVDPDLQQIFELDPRLKAFSYSYDPEKQESFLTTKDGQTWLYGYDADDADNAFSIYNINTKELKEGNDLYTMITGDFGGRKQQSNVKIVGNTPIKTFIHTPVTNTPLTRTRSQQRVSRLSDEEKKEKGIKKEKKEGKGIGRKTTKNLYANFGKVRLNLRELKNNIVKFQYRTSTQPFRHIPKAEVSNSLVEAIQYILDHGKIGPVSHLTTNEKVYLKLMINKSEADVDTSSLSAVVFGGCACDMMDDEKLKQKMIESIGAIKGGNDSSQIRNYLSDVLSTLLDRRLITAKSVRQLTKEYILDV